MAEKVRDPRETFGLGGRILLLDIIQTALNQPGRPKEQDSPAPEAMLGFEDELAVYLLPDLYTHAERGRLPAPHVREARALKVARLMPALFTELFLEGVIVREKYDQGMASLADIAPDDSLRSEEAVILELATRGDERPSDQLPLFAAEGQVA